MCIRLVQCWHACRYITWQIPIHGVTVIVRTGVWCHVKLSDTVNTLFYATNTTLYCNLTHHNASQRITPHHTTLHYTTLHYTTLHYTTLHYTTLHHTSPHHTTPHHTTPQRTTPHHTHLLSFHSSSNKISAFVLAFLSVNRFRYKFSLFPLSELPSQEIMYPSSLHTNNWIPT